LKNCKTVKQQIKAMRRRWPNFQVTTAQSSVVWHGTVQPNELSYLIHIDALIGLQKGNNWFVLSAPIVKVIRPRLKLQWDVEEKPLPHVYLDKQAPELSPLCLYDPAKHEWTPNYLIADTIVPWACIWLSCYEMWSATGEWLGGGRHDPPTIEDQVA